MLESLFDKVAGLRASRKKKRFQHKCFPVKFAKFLRAPVCKNICEQLLLKDFFVIKQFSHKILIKAKTPLSH